MTNRPQLLLEMIDMIKTQFLEVVGWRRRAGQFYEPPPDVGLSLGNDPRSWHTLAGAFSDAERLYRASDRQSIDEQVETRVGTQALVEECRRLHAVIAATDADTVQAAAHALAAGLSARLTFFLERDKHPWWGCLVTSTISGKEIAMVQCPDGRMECALRVVTWLNENSETLRPLTLESAGRSHG